MREAHPPSPAGGCYEAISGTQAHGGCPTSALATATHFSRARDLIDSAAEPTARPGRHRGRRASAVERHRARGDRRRLATPPAQRPGGLRRPPHAAATRAQACASSSVAGSNPVSPIPVVHRHPEQDCDQLRRRLPRAVGRRQADHSGLARSVGGQQDHQNDESRSACPRCWAPAGRTAFSLDGVTSA